jgi:hypothetical protein
MDEMKPPEVVYAVDMVRMGMGEEHGIDTGDPFADHLLSKIRRGIHQDIFSPRLDNDRGAAPFVAGVTGRTDGAAAADHRDAGGGAAA